MAQQPPRKPAPPASAVIAQLFRKPQFLLPLIVVAGMLGIAFGVQPGGPTDAKGAVETPVGLDLVPAETDVSPTPSPSPVETATAASTPTAAATVTSTATDPAPGSATDVAAATNEVAGVQSTPSPTLPADDRDYSRDTTQCGALQETAVALAVEQNIAGVSVRAQKAAVYPIDYFRCILMATGGREAVALAGSIGDAATDGATHAVLIDLWTTNAGRDFAQVNLKTSSIAAAGQTFSPIATLGGRAEVVVSSGQGRNVTLVGVLTNIVGETTGPMTVTIDAPLVGGKPTAGKYQLFLPTP